MSYYGKLYINDAEVITTLTAPELNVKNATSGFTTTVKGSDTATGNYTLTLPVDDGTSGQILSTDGSGVLSWASSGPTGTDVTLTGTSPTITLSGASANLTIGDASDTVTIAGNLVVSGTTTAVSSQNVLIADNFQIINAEYSTNSPQSGGIVVNYSPTAVTQAGATGGVASTSTITVTAGASGYVAGDLILVTSATSPSNNGLFEFLSENAGTPNVITIQGTPVTSFAQSAFVADVADTGYTTTKVSVAQLSVDPSSGAWRVSSGSTAATVNTFNTLITEGTVATAVSVDPNSSTGGGLTVDNTASLSSSSLVSISASGGQSGGDLVLITGVNGQTAVNVADGDVKIADNLAVSGLITADDFDSATATTLLIGKSTATKVEIADTGVVTEVQGSLTVESKIDTTGASALLLGDANATSIEIADTGITTTVQGPLSASEGLTVTGDLVVNGQVKRGVTVRDTTSTVLITDFNIITSTTAAAVTLTLPTLSGSTDGISYTFVNTTGTNPLTIARGGTDTFEGSVSSIVLTNQYQTVQLTALGTTWYFGF